jgi:hypothetical protein
LQEWIKGKKNFDGGIAVQDGPNGWKINNSKTYSYSPAFHGWDSLAEKLL